MAGTGVPGSGGDGEPATQAQLVFPERVAVAADSSFYILDAGSRVLRVGTDGIILRVAGTGAAGFSGDGGPATAAALNAFGLAAAPDGGFYIADFNNHRVRRVGPDGIINTIVNYSSQGGQPTSVRLAADGSVLIGVEFGGARTPQVDSLKLDGSVVTVAGGGPSAIQQGIPATQANLGTSLRGVAAAPDGSIFVAPGDGNDRLLRIGPALPGFTGGQTPIVSGDGSELYVFDADGKHLRTQDALTGTVLLEFGYDASGRLTQVIKKTGGIDNVTTIQHDGAGNPTAIIGPFGQITTLAVDANGFLNRLGNPAGETFQMTSDGGGLLSSYTDPRGKASTFAFDADGRLLHDADAVGGTQDFARTTTADQATVTRTTALQRITTYATQNLPGDVQKRAITEPDGTESQSQETIDAGTTHATAPDGSASDTVIGPDPRFGMQAPISKSLSTTLPSSLKLNASKVRTAVLNNPSDPLSLVSLTDVSTVAGRSTTSTYTASTRTMLLTTPAGRTASFTIDSLGRAVTSQIAGLNAANAAYDNRGRIATFNQGTGAEARTISFSYNAAGFVEAITDPIGRTVQFAYDPAGRVISKTFPTGVSRASATTPPAT